MVSKKFAVFFSVLILLIVVGSLGMFFAMLRLRAESEGALARRIEAMMQAYRQVSLQREGWEISRRQFSAVAAETIGEGYLQHINRYVPVFENINDYYPTGIAHLHIVQVLEQQGSWKLIRNASGDKWIDEDWVPEEILMDVPVFNQQILGLPTGCEIVALAMLINKHVEIDVFCLLYEMPRNDDPLLGFRGDPFTRGGFTILPPALLEMTERHIGSAVDMTGASIEDIQAQLALGRPVLAWVRGMFGFNVHVITLTGFNQYGFFYNDPWLGGVNEFITYRDFLAMWEGPIRDMRLNRVYPPRIALSF